MPDTPTHRGPTRLRKEHLMIVLLDTSQPLGQCAQELGCPVEQLLTPLTRYHLQQPDAGFAIDNGAFTRFDKAAFRALLQREAPRKAQCHFVAVPDVVGSARRTLEAFHFWWALPCLKGWPLALVAQDGQEHLEIPWYLLAAIFLGGTTEWKMSVHATHIIKTAQLLDKWVHVGRVNTPARFEYFAALGADSIDGTGLAQYTWMRERIYQEAHTPQLFPRQEVA